MQCDCVSWQQLLTTLFIDLNLHLTFLTISKTAIIFIISVLFATRHLLSWNLKSEGFQSWDPESCSNSEMFYLLCLTSLFTSLALNVHRKYIEREGLSATPMLFCFFKRQYHPREIFMCCLGRDSSGLNFLALSDADGEIAQ